MKIALICMVLNIAAYAQITVSGGVSITGGTSISFTNPVLVFSSPTNTNVDQTSAPAGLLGVTGAINSTITDVTGNNVIRATNYSVSGGTTGTAAFRTNSDSNDNVWSIDNKAFIVFRTGGALYFEGFDPVGLTVSPKGTATNRGFGDAAVFSHTTPMMYFGYFGSLIQSYLINPAHAAWTGATGNSDVTAAITPTTILDVSSGCSGLAYSRYTTIQNIYTIDAADKYMSFRLATVADNGTQIFMYDSSRGCYWFDARTMMQGGAWGTPGLVTNAATVLLPVPAAPTVTATTGGSLTSTHVYNVCVTYTKVSIGETPCSSNSSVTVTAPNNAISVTPPVNNLATTVSTATGFNVYACDNTASPGCTPNAQTNGTNASGSLAPPTGLSLACTTNCSGSTTYQLWVQANNAGGASPLSTITSSAVGLNAAFTLSLTQVANAATYTVYTDYLFNMNVNASAGTCAAGTCTLTVQTNPSQVGILSGQNQTVPIATTPVVTSLLSGTLTAPVTNTTGTTIHDVKNDGTGWLLATVPGNGSWQSAYNGNGNILLDTNTGFLLFGNSITRNDAINAPLLTLGHKVSSFTKVYGNDSNTTHPVVFTLSDSSSAISTSKVTLSTGYSNTGDQHFSAQMQVPNYANPWYIGSDGLGWLSHAIPNAYLIDYLYALENVSPSPRFWKLCQNWESGLQGFNSQVSGHPTVDGKFIVFSSDMGVGTGVTSGQLGDASGNATCTDNTTPGTATSCRTDIYICVTR